MRLPIAQISAAQEKRITDLGGKPLNLYKTLAHSPELLSAWIEFAYSLRKNCQTPRRLRELLILRQAQMTQSEYEWAQHLRMAKSEGVTDAEIHALSEWRESNFFSSPEKAALLLGEAMVAGNVTDDIFADVQKNFNPIEMIELILTSSFYCMVPRVLNTLKLPVE